MAYHRPAILVTGGAGYIGSHTCKALAVAGYEPVAYDSLHRGHARSVKWGPLEVGELMDGDRLREVIAAHQPEGVIHFAALAYVAESTGNPLAYYGNNLVGTMTLLQAMKDNGVKRIVFSSTCATYGKPETIPICEDAAQAPISPYGQSKLMVERILRDCAGAEGLSAVALRYFNAAGADPDGEIGEDHDPETHLIPLALGAAAGLRGPLTVFGTDHPTPDGTCIRDYVHVSDLADAHVKALLHFATTSGFSALNLGTGTGISVLEILRGIRDVTGREVPYSCGPRREGDPPALVADVALASRTLGWRPQRSDLRTILETAWNWMWTTP
jgi:UDP-arabinose 4-epimerase